MKKHSFSNSFSLFLSVLAYLSLTWLFLRALLFPVNHIDFIYNNGLAIFVIEFISMHSSVVIYGEPTSSSKKVPKTTLFFVYAVFLLPLLFLSNNLWRVVYFLISLFAKFMGHKSTPESKHFVSTFIVFFITFPIIFFSGIWNFLFPLPQEVLINKPQNVQGLVVESPQTFLVWGIVYSIGVAIVELILFFHSRNYHYVDKYKIKERI